ncbi:MAG: phage head closure protein [Notoacmeibacter sp.]|nr:phage head closure protein [Notoacmeibacter sp.]
MALTFIGAGLLRTPLELETPVLSDDGAGGHETQWHAVATVMAALEPVSALSRFAAAQQLEEVSHRAIIRKRGDVRAGMRFRRGTRSLVIMTVHDPDETGRYLTCMLREELP